MMNRIAIMGAGSLGTILGAFISKKRQCDLIDVYQAHVDALNKDGAHVIGSVDFTTPVHAITPDQMEGEYDLIIYMTKQTFNSTALPQAVKHLKKDGILMTLQNGLPEPACCEYWPKEQVYGAPVNWGATFIGPGVSKLTSEKNSLGFTLGTVTGAITPQLDEIKEVLELMCPVHISTNLLGIRWCKVLINSTLSGMSTVCGGTFGDVMDDPIGSKCVAYIGRESIRVCSATGVHMEPFGTADWNIVFNFTDEEGPAKTIADYARITAPHRALEASMLQDLRNGRKREIDAINGVVSSTGKKYGVPTPICDQVVDIVKSIEAGKLKMSKDNFKLFKF
jgi:2-dehydropantoate 2-reductase